jgi:hypothetical protein
MRALIDASAWPEALAHYRMFPFEPSASAELDFRIEHIVPLAGINLEKVLDEMNKAGDEDEAEIFIASHGTVAEGATGGLTMPLARDCDVDAMRDEVRAVTEASIAIQESASDPLSWARFIEDPQARRQVQTTATPEQGPGLLQQWLQARADSLHLSKAKLLELATKRNQVAGRRFQRIEVRACNLGAFPEAMQALAEFFGAERLLAPLVTTLCGRLRVHLLEDPSQYREWIQSRGAFGTGGAFEEMEGASGRTFGEAFRLRIQESSPDSNTFELEAAALSEEAVRKWVEDYIMHGSGYTGHGTLQIAALWTFGRPGLPQPYVLPGESEYRSLIASTPL